jgi:CubicO group peptidase (beta-lactamase class C family)
MNTVRSFSQTFSDLTGTRRALGFDVPPLDGTGSTSKAFSVNSIGHLGFTGTSLWMDLDSGDFAILLTNRVHPNRDDLRIRQLRREFHELIRSKK